MRINRYVAGASGLSRRQVDRLIAEGRVKVDGQIATVAQDILPNQQVTFDNKLLKPPKQYTTIAINKPAGYVVSRKGQGALTIYSLIPEQYHKLKPVGRLDKDSSGLLLLSNDGQLTQSLTHPSFNKQKVYEVTLDREIHSSDIKLISQGVRLEDGISRLDVQQYNGKRLRVTLSEGRNRQIRRTFKAVGYSVNQLKRISFGEYSIGNLKPGECIEVAS